MYTLLDGVKQNYLYSETFEIPSEEEIKKLVKGDIVKLGFEEKGKLTERMWVVISSISGNEFKGYLDNEPFAINIKIGDEITFKEKHILGIFSE